MTEPAPDAVRVPRRRFAWVRAASDRVPTKWFAAVGTGVFLAVTAAFGGLATAAEPAVAVGAVDTAIDAAPFTVTVERAVLLDEFPEAGVYVEDGERVLALQVEVVNDWTEPLPSRTEDGLAGTVRIEGLEAPEAAAHFDDATLGPRLQPGVPTTIVFTWAVDADRFAEGDEIVVALDERTVYTASFVASGRWWDDPVAVATVPVTLTDAGSGSDG